MASRDLPKAVLLDVDGTLYDQPPVRTAILGRILRAYVKSPIEGLSMLRALRAYRKAQELLRLAPDAADSDLAMAQIILAAKRTGLTNEFIATSVVRWMEHEPLDLVARARRPGLCSFLDGLKARGIRIAAVSDYPAAAKLEAMGILPSFDLVVTAQDAEVQAFKPNPRGLQVALGRLGVRPDEALYIGDRPEVDATAAANAGLPCVIIGARGTGTALGRWATVAGYRELGRFLGCPERSFDSERQAHELI